MHTGLHAVFSHEHRYTLCRIRPHRLIELSELRTTLRLVVGMMIVIISKSSDVRRAQVTTMEFAMKLSNILQ
jgi:hypothetical protein